MTTPFGPCENWEVGPFPCQFDCESPEITGGAVAVATEMLDALTGRQFGTCTMTLRPCRRECRDYPWPEGWREQWPGGAWVSPVLHGGRWYNIACGRCGSSCSCSSISEVILPEPVAEIISVTIDGDLVPTGSYRVDDWRRLVRTDGGQWPRCNNLAATSGDGVFEVTLKVGIPVPDGGKWAMGELVCELIQAMSGEDCRLPKNVTQLVRQGVTIEMPQISELFPKGQTGLYLVDAFVATWNPNRLQGRPRVWNVDDPFQRFVST